MIGEEFVSAERKQFPVQLGRNLASALSGFVAGVVVASIIWYAASSFLPR